MAFIPAIFKRGLNRNEIASAQITATCECDMASPSYADFDYRVNNFGGVTWTQSGQNGNVSVNSGTNYLITVSANKGGQYIVQLRNGGRYTAATLTSTYAQVRIDGGSWTDATTNTKYTATSSFAMRVGFNRSSTAGTTGQYCFITMGAQRIGD